MNWRRVLRVITFPVTVPVRAVKRKVEQTMWTILFGQLRHLLTALGTWLLVQPGLTDAAELQTAIGAVVVLVSFAASILSKVRAKKAP